MLLIGLLCCCHLLGDFSPLSTSWMLQAKQFGKPLFPILVHALVHGFLMVVVLFFYVSIPMLVQLFFLQVTAHFFIDTLKGRLNGWFPSLQNMHTKGYWFVFGVDQWLHQMTILAMAYLALK